MSDALVARIKRVINRLRKECPHPFFVHGVARSNCNCYGRCHRGTHHDGWAERACLMCGLRERAEEYHRDDLGFKKMKLRAGRACLQLEDMAVDTALSKWCDTERFRPRLQPIRIILEAFFASFQRVSFHEN